MPRFPTCTHARTHTREAKRARLRFAIPVRALRYRETTLASLPLEFTRWTSSNFTIVPLPVVSRYYKSFRFAGRAAEKPKGWHAEKGEKAKGPERRQGRYPTLREERFSRVGGYRRHCVTVYTPAVRVYRLQWLRHQ